MAHDMKKGFDSMIQKVTDKVGGLKVAGQSSSSSSPELGVCWGQGQNKVEPPPQLVVAKCLEVGIQRVRFYSVLSPAAEKALAHTGIKVSVTLWPSGPMANRQPVEGPGHGPPCKGQAAAEQWVEAHLVGPRQRGVEVDFVLVGNEPNFDKEYDRSMVPALGNLCDALAAKGLRGKVRASVPMGGGGLYADSWPPSKCRVNPKHLQQFKDLCHHLHSYGSPYMAHIHPFWGCNPDKRPGCESYYLFRPQCSLAFTDPANNLRYGNCFDSDLDAVRHALAKLGYPEMEVAVGETGWPTAGSDKARAESAKAFTQAMLGRIRKGQGSPLKPGRVPSILLFEMVDSDKKHGPEAHWGLFTYDAHAGTLSAKYDLNWAKAVQAK